MNFLNFRFAQSLCNGRLGVIAAAHAAEESDDGFAPVKMDLLASLDASELLKTKKPATSM